MLLRLVFLLLLVSASGLPAQAKTKSAQPLQILAIGDSMMAWNQGSRRSIAEVAGRQLGARVENRSVVGARMTDGVTLAGNMGFSIPRQYRKARWDWVIVNGGGNDLWLGCGCRKCKANLDRMLSANAKTGVLADLVYRLNKAGSKIVYVGYLRSPGVDSMIEHCRDEIEVYEHRLRLLEKRYKGFYFLSNAALVPNGDRSYHSGDMIHPSLKGAQAIGQRVARLIREHSRR